MLAHTGLYIWGPALRFVYKYEDFRPPVAKKRALQIFIFTYVLLFLATMSPTSKLIQRRA